jgi:dolichol-phosphate mannosyltransferase
MNDPYPYIRGLVSELGYPIKTIEFKQPKRFAGISSNNFYSLYDMALLGIVNHSVVPIRLATFFGFICAITSMCVALYYLVMKLIFWDSFPLGVAPLVIGMFFFISIQLIFLGIIGEYIISIQRSLRKLPIVTEKTRINYQSNANE